MNTLDIGDLRIKVEQAFLSELDSDKVIDKETTNYIRRWIGMTKIAKMFEEEKNEAVKEAVKRSKKKQRKRKPEEEVIKLEMDIATRMLEDGEPIEKIYRYAPNAAQRLYERVKEIWHKRRRVRSKVN